MELWDFIRILVKRWFIVVPGMLIVLEAATLVTSRVGAQYQATGSVLLVAPSITPAVSSKIAGPPIPSNPYFSGSLDVSAQLLVRVTSKDDATVARFREAGATADYTIITGTGPGTENHSPVITISASGTQSAQVLETIRVVSLGIQQVLAERQKASGAPPQTWIRADILTVPQQATRLLGSELRSFVAVAGLGTAGVVLLVFILEGLQQRRRIRRASRLVATRHHDGEEPLVAEASRDVLTVESRP